MYTKHVLAEVYFASLTETDVEEAQLGTSFQSNDKKNFNQDNLIEQSMTIYTAKLIMWLILYNIFKINIVTDYTQMQ